MSQYKNQHFVPQFYLKRFSHDHKRINLWNISSGIKVPNAALNKQCSKDNFYGDGHDSESDLSMTEDESAKLLQLASDKHIMPQWASFGHLMLACFVGLQYLRTRAGAEELDRILDEAIYAVEQDPFASNSRALEMIATRPKNTAAFAVSMAFRTFPCLLDLRYAILVNQTKVPFITSDHPVSLYNPFFLFEPFPSKVGFGSKGLLIMLPIDSEHAVLLYDHNVYEVKMDSECLVAIDQEQDVWGSNSLQACTAHDHLYFRDEDFNIERVLRENSRFRIENRTKRRLLQFCDGDSYADLEIIAQSRQPITKKLSFSFLKTKRRASKWRKRYKTKRTRPPYVRRETLVVGQYWEALGEVKRGARPLSAVLEFMQRG